MIREIDGGGSSHISQNSTIAHFGLEAATQVDSAMVKWTTGGKVQSLVNESVNQLITVEEINNVIQREKKTSGRMWWWILSGFVVIVLVLMGARLFQQ